MNLTEHAKARFQQRGFSSFSLDIIQNYGRYKKAPGGVTKIFFGKKEAGSLIGQLKRDIQLLDKIKNSTMIIANNDIITIYK